MRIQRITTVPPSYLDQFRGLEPDSPAISYQECLREFLADCYGWADYWSVAFAKHGIEMEEIVGNSRTLQTHWARENGIPFDEASWMPDIVRAQVIKYRPDVLFLTDYWNFSAEYIDHLRASCPSIRLVVVWCGAPFRHSGIFQTCDLVLSCIPDMVEMFRRMGRRSELMDHAFEPRILNRLPTEVEPVIDFSFLGSIVMRSQFHLERERLLRELIDQIEIEIWSDLNPVSLCDRAKFRSRILAYDLVAGLRRSGIPEAVLGSIPLVGKVLKWKERPFLPLSINRRLQSHSHPPLFGLEMFQKIRESKLVLNKHIDISANSSSNMRLYEVTGVGSCLVTDWKQDVARNFEPDVEIITYRSPEECLEKVNYLLEHDAQREAIAQAGQRRTLRDHTFDNRAPQLIEYINSMLYAS